MAKSAKKTAKRKRVPPAKPAAPVDATVPAPAPAYVAPGDRTVAVDQQAMVVAALHRARPIGRGGSPNKCWTALTHEERVAIAEAHVVRNLGEEKIRAEYAEVCRRAAISKSSMDRFLRDVRKSHNAIYEERLALLTEVDAAAFATGDLPALMGIVYSRLAPRFVAAGLAVIGPEASAKEMHPVLRFMESMTEAAKVQAEAKHKELQSVLLAIRAEAADGRRAKTQREKGESQQRIVDLIDTFVRGGQAA